MPEPDVVEDTNGRIAAPQLRVRSSSSATLRSDDGDVSAIGASLASSGESPAPFALLPHEKVLSTFGRNAVVLTTHRVRGYDDSVGRSSVTSIMLDQVASTSVMSISKPWLWMVGALLLVGSVAVADRNGKAWMAGVFFAIALIVAYFITRRHVLSVASAAAAVTVDVGGVSENSVREVIDSIEAAQDARYQAFIRRQ